MKALDTSSSPASILGATGVPPVLFRLQPFTSDTREAPTIQSFHD